ncbi:hypothetical protein HMPREF3192_00903 [Atopobium deltae]|uniref:Uncharacterized protein n=1 Tax=Atopobium deltae TaxID=1393034 RepID=A0A133XTT3_9ACTN|nr:hypothetical protein HMPREF3192_00903 [Atopobium deltae]
MHTGLQISYASCRVFLDFTSDLLARKMQNHIFRTINFFENASYL